MYCGLRRRGWNNTLSGVQNALTLDETVPGVDFDSTVAWRAARYVEIGYSCDPSTNSILCPSSQTIRRPLLSWQLIPPKQLLTLHVGA